MIQWSSKTRHTFCIENLKCRVNVEQRTVIPTAFATHAHRIWRFLPWNREYFCRHPVRDLRPWERSDEKNWRQGSTYLIASHYFPAAQTRGKCSVSFSSGQRKRGNGGVKPREPHRSLRAGRSACRVQTKLSPWKLSRSRLERPGRSCPERQLLSCDRLRWPVTVIHYSVHY